VRPLTPKSQAEMVLRQPKDTPSGSKNIPGLGDGNCCYFFIAWESQMVTARYFRKFSLAFQVHTCHNMSTTCGRHAVFKKFRKAKAFLGRTPPPSDESSCHSAFEQARRRLAASLGWVHLAKTDPAAEIDGNAEARFPHVLPANRRRR